MALTDVSILDVSSRTLLRFDDVVCLLYEVLNKHFCGDCDNKGCIVRAGHDVFVGVDYLLDACH